MIEAGAWILIAAALVAAIAGIYRYKTLDLPGRIFCVLACGGFCIELIATVAGHLWKTNLAEYNIFSLIEFALVSAYFNYSIDVFRRRNIGIMIGGFGIVAGMLNMVFLQSITTLNFYFLFFEAIMIIGMSLFYFFRLLLLQNGLELRELPHFRLTVILCAFWSITFFFWGLCTYTPPSLSNALSICLHLISIAYYMAIGITLWKYPKPVAAYE